MSAKCYSGRIFQKIYQQNIALLKSSTKEDIFIFLLVLFIYYFSLSLLSSCFFLSRYFRMSLLRIGTPTPIKSTTAKIVKSIQSPHISFFFIIRMDKMIETAYIATIEKTARKTRSIGEDSTIEIIEFPIAGILERRSKVTKKPATGIYINTRPLIEPYL